MNELTSKLPKAGANMPLPFFMPNSRLPRSTPLVFFPFHSHRFINFAKALTSPDIMLRMNFVKNTIPSIGKVFGMLEGYQRKFLRGLAHRLKPIVFIGQNGLTGAIVKTTDEALNKHELIKVKFNAYKEKVEKKEIIAEIENRTSAQLVGLIGHTAIFYRENSDPEKQKITLPDRSS
jgi:RNA-binding protein